ncbi:hypothetical protein HZ994_06135 [Akkermansiaceae bacterium]|nr:hypothetical protein HZ994_06135 [Akkermansiaceae bacterium]
MKPESCKEFRELFPSCLKKWFWHCLINALPSYLIAVVWLGLWAFPVSHVAMFCAVFTFVLAYSVLTSLPGPLSRNDSLFARAMNAGLLVRLVISVITVTLIPFGPMLMLTPDLWCGRIAAAAVAWGYDFLGYKATLFDRLDGGSGAVPGFMEVYLTTMLEGLILSFMLFIFCFIAIIILQVNDRKRMFREGRI